MNTFMIDGRWGKLILLKGDMISMYTSFYGEWCEAEVRLFSLLLEKGDNAVEVGAFLGTHSVAIAKIIGAGKLLCFEPQRIPSQILCGNIALNNLNNVFALQKAVSDSIYTTKMETTDFSTPWNYSAYSLSSGLNAEQNFSGPVNEEPVDVVSLDHQVEALGIGSVQLLKVDAEGHELKV